MCNTEQMPRGPSSYTPTMQMEYTKATLTALWVLSIGWLGYATGTTSVAGWMVLAALAVTPPMIVRRFWRVPAPTMSESIQEALR